MGLYGNIIKVEITQKMRDKARKMSDEILATDIVKNTPNYTGLNEPNRFYYGFIGETVIWKLLYERNKKYIYDPKTDGKPDKGDFLVSINGENIDIDVKISPKNYASRILVPITQYQRRPHKYYIGGKIVEGEVWIYGYCEYNELKADNSANFKVPPMSKKLVELKPIESLLLKIDNKT